MEFEVQKEQSAVHLKSGSVNVLSTPSMILYMEQVARYALEEYLTDGYSSVGIEVCIKHLKAVGVGETVTARCELVSQQDKKFKFKVEVSHKDQLLGTGEHTRYIIAVEEFMQTLNSRK